MRNEFPTDDEALAAEAARLLAARQLAEQPRRPTARPVFTMSRLLRAVLRPDPVADAPIHAARRQDLGLARAYRDLVQRHSLAFVPMAAAAATEGLTERVVDGCRIRLKPSASHADRTFVVIELDDPARPPKLMECLLGEGPQGEGTPADVEPVALPDPVDGKIQLMRRSDDPLVRALADERFAISLR